MKKFIVEICIMTAGYESHHRKLVSAKNKQSAERKALIGELHCSQKDFGFNYMNDGNFWINPEQIAEVQNVVEVQKDELPILEKYLDGSLFCLSLDQFTFN